MAWPSASHTSARLGVGAEQAGDNAGLVGLHRRFGLLIDRQFADEAQDQRGIGSRGVADLQAGRAHAQPRALATLWRIWSITSL